MTKSVSTSSPGSPYTLTNQFYPTGGGVFFGFTETAAADYTGQATLWIQVASALTNAGGFVPINTGAGYGWGVCSVPSCATASNPGDLSGNLAGAGNLAAVPEPATLTLISLGLAGVAASRKRRSDRSQAGVRLS